MCQCWGSCRTVLVVYCTFCVLSGSLARGAAVEQGPDIETRLYGDTQLQTVRCSVADSGITDYKSVFAIELKLLNRTFTYIAKVTESTPKPTCNAEAGCKNFAVRGNFSRDHADSFVEIVSLKTMFDDFGDKNYKCFYNSDIEKNAVVTSVPAEAFECEVHDDDSATTFSVSLTIKTDENNIFLGLPGLKSNHNVSLYDIDGGLPSVYMLTQRPGYTRLLVGITKNISRTCGGLTFDVTGVARWTKQVEENCAAPDNRTGTGTGELYDEDTPKNGTDTLAKIVIGVLGAVVVILAVALLWCARRKRSSVPRQDEEEQNRRNSSVSKLKLESVSTDENVRDSFV
ncbi:hypothetical protein BaRGS_00038287 [Batillaria attramentaria]|uniref:Uncharacterized protein n=1 Tax=Batillaria attramentaria TaxID=370345 RepID=A0ABD0J691_9CAEN